MPHVVRSSERRDKRRCRRAWHLGWREGWQPIIGPRALEFGTGVHVGMQAVYDPDLWDSTTPSQKLLRGIEAFRACCEAQCEAYLEVTEQQRFNWEGRDDYKARIELGEKMLEYYVLQIHPVADVGLRPVMVEKKFQVPILDENGVQLRCNNSPHCGQVHEANALVVHEGRIDAIMEDTRRGGYWPLDWKTVGGDKAIDGTEKNTGRFSDPNLVWLHDQLNTYCWALRHVLKIDVRGYILAEIRKDWPKVPAPLQGRNGGALYSRAKTQSTNLAVYKPYVQEHDPEGYATGAYDEYLDWLGGKEAPKFHERFTVPKSDAELREVGNNLIREVREMLKPDVEIYAEPNSTAFSPCKICDFKKPCEMMIRGMDYGYTLRSGFVRVDRTV